VSDNWIVFIPEDPVAEPTHEAANKACGLLKTFLPEAESVLGMFWERVIFVDAGRNWSGVRCPACSADVEAWWTDAMSAAAEQNFVSLRVTMPCCGTDASLHELDYPWPVGFASFCIEVLNPPVATTTEAQDRQLEECLGIRLKKIHRHI
jgi:hypothetical protein